MKKVMFLLLTIFITITITACGDIDTTTEALPEQPSSETQEQKSEEVEEDTEVVEDDEQKEESESKDADVPREHRNALKSAQNYIDLMPFSEKGLFEQLTSEFGDQYPEDAAKYAIENVVVDYNEEALEAAMNYQELMPMSDQELFEQLTSEYGEQFTEEQARYAIDNLPE